MKGITRRRYPGEQGRNPEMMSAVVPTAAPVAPMTPMAPVAMVPVASMPPASPGGNLEEMMRQNLQMQQQMFLQEQQEFMRKRMHPEPQMPRGPVDPLSAMERQMSQMQRWQQFAQQHFTPQKNPTVETLNTPFMGEIAKGLMGSFSQFVQGWKEQQAMNNSVAQLERYGKMYAEITANHDKMIQKRMEAAAAGINVSDIPSPPNPQQIGMPRLPQQPNQGQAVDLASYYANQQMPQQPMQPQSPYPPLGPTQYPQDPNPFGGMQPQSPFGGMDPMMGHSRPRAMMMQEGPGMGMNAPGGFPGLQPAQPPMMQQAQQQANDKDAQIARLMKQLQDERDKAALGIAAPVSQPQPAPATVQPAPVQAPPQVPVPVQAPVAQPAPQTPVPVAVVQPEPVAAAPVPEVVEEGRDPNFVPPSIPEEVPAADPQQGAKRRRQRL